MALGRHTTTARLTLASQDGDQQVVTQAFRAAPGPDHTVELQKDKDYLERLSTRLQEVAIAKSTATSTQMHQLNEAERHLTKIYDGMKTKYDCHLQLKLFLFL